MTTAKVPINIPSEYEVFYSEEEYIPLILKNNFDNFLSKKFGVNYLYETENSEYDCPYIKYFRDIKKKRDADAKYYIALHEKEYEESNKIYKQKIMEEKEMSWKFITGKITNEKYDAFTSKNDEADLSADEAYQTGYR